MNKFTLKRGEKCPVCKKTVYFNEKVLALGSSWHKACFKCQNCKKGLTLGSQCDKDGQLYCQPCYQRLYGARGFRGSSFSSMIFGSFDNKGPAAVPDLDKMEQEMAFNVDLDNLEEEDEEKPKRAVKPSPKLEIQEEFDMPPPKPKSNKVMGLEKLKQTKKARTSSRKDKKIALPNLLQRVKSSDLSSANAPQMTTVQRNTENLQEASTAFLTSARNLFEVFQVSLDDPDTRKVLGESMSRLLRESSPKKKKSIPDEDSL